MTTGEIIKQLITAENYPQIRIGISDEFIKFIKEMLPYYYSYFSEKEEAYQTLINSLKNQI